MKDIMRKWRAGKLSTAEALKQLGVLMDAARAKGQSLAPFEGAVNELIGMPSEPQTESEQLDSVGYWAYNAHPPSKEGD